MLLSLFYVKSLITSYIKNTDKKLKKTRTARKLL